MTDIHRWKSPVKAPDKTDLNANDAADLRGLNKENYNPPLPSHALWTPLVWSQYSWLKKTETKGLLQIMNTFTEEADESTFSSTKSDIIISNFVNVLIVISITFAFLENVCMYVCLYIFI